MKKLLLLTLILCLVLPCFGCDTPDTPPAGDDSTNETTTEETTEEETTEASTDTEWILEEENQLIAECNPPRGKVVWDTHPREVVFPIVVPELDNAKIEYPNIKVFYLNEEPLITEFINQLYLSDLTGDGYPELCFTVSHGSGIVNQYLLVYDYTTKSVVFHLSDRMYHDYSLYLKDGFLLIRETNYPYPRKDLNRIGTFAYDGSKISVTWSDRTD